jgi:manganese/iron transport system substrate-binding protein
MMTHSTKRPRQIGFTIASLLTALLIGNVAPRSTAQSKPTVVVTTALLCDVTKQIAQDTVDLKCLVDAGSDPHTYQLKTDDRKAIETAKLVLYSGYDFEPQLVKAIQTSSNPAPKVAINEIAVPKPQTFEEDGKTETDPHVFHNAENGAEIAKAVGQQLSNLQPSQSSLYRENTNKLSDELMQIHTWIKSQISTIPMEQRKLVTTHDAFGYYSTAYDLPVLGALQGLSTEEQPTAKRVAELVREIRSSKVPTVFVELTANPKLLNAVAKEAKVKVAEQELFADGIGEAGSVGESYPKMLISNTKTIVIGLGGKFTEFKLKTSQAQSNQKRSLVGFSDR